VVFAVGALDSYLSSVSAEVMIYQCQQDDVTGDTRTIMRTVSQQLHGLALELAITEG
jgi:cob(I)alamin adenosyltransferase